MTPEYHFTSAQLADYLDKARPMMVLAERKRCAKIAENWRSSYGGPRDLEVAQSIAAAILAERSQPRMEGKA